MTGNLQTTGHWLQDFATTGLTEHLDRTNRSDLEPGNLKDNHLIGSASVLYGGIEDKVLRVTFSQGYVYPSLLQLATGAYAGSRFINPNLKLEPETSDTLELGFRHQDKRWTIDATLFASQSRKLYRPPALPCQAIRAWPQEMSSTETLDNQDPSGQSSTLLTSRINGIVKPYLNLDLVSQAQWTGWVRFLQNRSAPVAGKTRCHSEWVISGIRITQWPVPPFSIRIGRTWDDRSWYVGIENIRGGSPWTSTWGSSLRIVTGWIWGCET